eukprot:scaffold92033_cov60-Phaeocystis_antarctica.AAC.1
MSVALAWRGPGKVVGSSETLDTHYHLEAAGGAGAWDGLGEHDVECHHELGQHAARVALHRLEWVGVGAGIRVRGRGRDRDRDRDRDSVRVRVRVRIRPRASVRVALPCLERCLFGRERGEEVAERHVHRHLQQPVAAVRPLGGVVLADGDGGVREAAVRQRQAVLDVPLRGGHHALSVPDLHELDETRLELDDRGAELSEARSARVSSRPAWAMLPVQGSSPV